YEVVQLFRRILTNNHKHHLAGLEMFQSFASRNQFAIRRKDEGNANNVASDDARIAQNQFEAGEPFPMFPDTFREEDLLRDKHHSAGFSSLPDWIKSKKIKGNTKVTRKYSNINAFWERVQISAGIMNGS